MVFRIDAKTKLLREKTREAINLAMEGRWHDAAALNAELLGMAPDDVEASSDVERHGLQLNLTVRREVRGRADSLGTYPVTLNSFGNRVRGSLTRRGAHDDRGEFASEIDELFRENTNWLLAVSQIPGRVKGLTNTIGAVDLEHSFAVITATGGFRNDRPATVMTKRDEVFGSVANLPRRIRETLALHKLTHNDLVLRVNHGGRPWADRVPGLFHLLNEDRRYVFVVEGDDIAPGGEIHNSVVVEVGANDDVRHHLGRRIVRIRGQQAGAHPQSDRSLMHHAG